MLLFNCVKDEHADRSINEPSLAALDDFMPETNFDDNTDDDPNSINVTEPEYELNEYKLKGGIYETSKTKEA